MDKKKLISKKQMEEEAAIKTPISVSVKQLDEQFPWLQNLKWVNSEDE